MLHINSFGKTLVVDKETRIILTTCQSNEIAKFITSSLLDTYTIQIADTVLAKYDKDWLTDSVWAKSLPMEKLELYTDLISNDIATKRKSAILFKRGYLLLLEQSTKLATSYDHLSDLNQDDLTMYLLNKDMYAESFSVQIGITPAAARSHLDFLANSLLSLHMRQKTLIWKYSRLLRLIKSEDDYQAWRSDLLNSTIFVGQV